MLANFKMINSMGKASFLVLEPSILANLELESTMVKGDILNLMYLSILGSLKMVSLMDMEKWYIKLVTST